MVNKWARYGQDIVKIWPRYGQDMAKIWPGYGQNVVKMWPKYVPRYRQDMVKKTDMVKVGLDKAEGWNGLQARE
jgi:hypothetical protein